MKHNLAANMYTLIVFGKSKRRNCWYAGKCKGVRGETHEAREFFLQSISVLVSRNLFSANFRVPPVVLLDMIGKEIAGDPLAVERAAVLYNLCWITLKSYTCKDTKYA